MSPRITPYTLSQMNHLEIVNRVKATALRETIALLQQDGIFLEPYTEERYDGPYRKNLPGAKPNTTYLVRYNRPRFTERGFVYDIPAARVESYDSNGDKVRHYYFHDLDKDDNAQMLSSFATVLKDDASKVLVIYRFGDDSKLSSILEIHYQDNGRAVIFQGNPNTTMEEGWFEVR